MTEEKKIDTTSETEEVSPIKCTKRECRDLAKENQVLKKDVETLKKHFANEVSKRMHFLKTHMGLSMHLYGNEIISEVIGLMRKEAEEIQKEQESKMDKSKLLKDASGNQIDCFECKKAIVTWRDFSNKASDNNHYCFGCYSAKLPIEFQRRINEYGAKETQEKLKMKKRLVKNEELTEIDKKDKLLLKVNAREAAIFDNIETIDLKKVVVTKEADHYKIFLLDKELIFPIKDAVSEGGIRLELTINGQIAKPIENSVHLITNEELETTTEQKEDTKVNK